jgi:hypothetical protein
MHFYWHLRSRALEPDLQPPLQMFDWLAGSWLMAAAFFVGQIELAAYMGFMVHAALNRSYQLRFVYKEGDRRGDTFMLRLFADWKRFTGHTFPSWAYNVPLYDRILQLWRTPNAEKLKPWLLAACDRHTHEAKKDTETKFHDFAGYNISHIPLEILMVLRLREHLGLINPVLDHPLMAGPFDCLPTVIPAYEPDHLILGSLQRVREDWPDFDEATSLKTMRTAARVVRRPPVGR